jgi:hypothetical protein
MIRPSEKGLDGSDWILITAVISWFHKVPVWWWVMIVSFAVLELISWAIYMHEEMDK